MLYRRYPYINRQYVHNKTMVPTTDIFNSDPMVEPQKTIDDIPLPNEEPLETPGRRDVRRVHPVPFLSFFKKRIGIEEILLIGLLFLLIQEGINDEFLIIILLYLLFTGIE